MSIIRLFLLTVFVISCSQTKDRIPIITGKEGKKLPPINLLLPDSSGYINTAELQRNHATVFFYFSPTCPHCRLQMRSIVSNISKVDDVQFIILTVANLESTKNFYDRYGIGKYQNIAFGIDTGFIFPSYFRTEKVPFIAIYEKDETLIHAFTGKVSVRQLQTLTQQKNIAQSIPKP